MLIPELARRGFVRVPLDARDAGSTEIRAAFPFGRFRRVRDGRYEIVEIQLHKHEPLAFRINFGAVGFGDFAHPTGRIDSESAWVHYLPTYYELYASPFWRRWFSATAWGRNRSPADAINASVMMATDLLSEVDATFATGQPGRHIRVVRQFLLDD